MAVMRYINSLFFGKLTRFTSYNQELSKSETPDLTVTSEQTWVISCLGVFV